MAKRQNGLIEEPLTNSIIGCFYAVYNTLRTLYEGIELTTQRLEVFDDRVVVEIKSTHTLGEVAPRQLFNYLRATNLEVGLLLHFGPKPRFFRIVASNQYKESIRSVR